ncbi:MAG: nucleoid-associated protein [Mucilaginibacter sp.]
MEVKLNTILIKNIIVHSIPKHKKDADGSVEPKYSKQESKLSDGLKLFFKDKITQALDSDKSFKICFNNSSTSPVSYISRQLLTKHGDNFIEHSKNLAKHLYDIQVGSNPEGILVCIFGTVNSKNTCFFLKLEMDKGVQLTLDPKTDSYDIEEVENLMLTQKTRIYKVAMFILRDDFEAKYDGKTMDFQIDLKQKKNVTTWFIDKFLGCYAYEDPKITTQKFYNLTRSFIDTIKEPIEQAKYIQDLNSYVQKNVSQLSPQEFANDYLESTEQKSNYKSFLESKDFSFSSFFRDTAQIENQVKKIMINFANDITIIGTKGVLNDKVKLEKLDNGQTRAEIVSRIKKIV